MKLTRLSLLSIVACLLSLVFLLSTTVTGYSRLQSAQRELRDLIELQHRLDTLSATSDMLLVQGAQDEFWAHYRGQAKALRRDLRALEEHSTALRATNRIDATVSALEELRAGQVLTSGSESEFATPAGEAPLHLPMRARIILSRVASHGMALDAAVASLLRDRQRALARQTRWIGGGFAAAALLFGCVCVLAFLLIQRRMAGPIRSLAATIRELAGGRNDVRAPVSGTDEMAHLAHAFNGLADQRQAAIADLEEHRRMLAESQRMAGIGSWQLRLDDMAVTWSEQTYRIFGLDPAEYQPTVDGYLEFVHADDRDAVRADQERLRALEPNEIEFRVVRRDGDIRHVHHRAAVEYDEAGAPERLTGTLQDITGQRRLTDYLHQYRRLIEASTDRFALIDSALHYTLCNQAYASLFQRDCADVEGRHINEVLGAMFGDAFVETDVRPHIEACLAGEPQSLETQRTYPHLGTRQVLIRYYPLAAPGGRIRQAAMVMTDLTDLKQAEAELREQRQLLDIAGRIARLGGWSVDVASGRVTCSEVAAQLYGIPQGRTLDVAELMDLYAPDRARVAAHYRACAERGVAFEDEFELRGAGGESRWLRTAGEPVCDQSRAVVRVQGAVQDITARKTAEREVTRLAQRLGTILDSITEAFITIGPDWRLDYVNAAAERLLQYPHGELTGKDLWEEFPGLIGTRIEQEYLRAMADGVSVDIEEYYAPLDMRLEVRAYPSEEGLAVFFRDVSERHAMLMQLEAQERDLRASRDELTQALETRQALINGLPAHIALIDGESNILDVNDQWRQFGRANDYHGPDCGVGANYLAVCETGIRQGADEAVSVRDELRALLDGERDTFTLEYPCHAPAQRRWFRLMAKRLSGTRGEAGESAAVLMHVDVTERKLAELELNRLAYEDALTALPSRNGFVRELQARMEAGWQQGAVVVVLDVRGLRDINDLHGYDIGDQLLRAIGPRLQHQAGEDAIVARIGGDEFAVFLPERSGCGAAQRRAAIDDGFARAFCIDSLAVDVSARFGYTLLGAEQRHFEDLLREAELALFQTSSGETASAWMPYTSVLHDEARQRTRLTHDLRRALERDEFRLHFQPKVDLSSGRLIGSEALMRWMHPEFGLQLPASFIPAAERSRLIGPMGDWAIREACRCLSSWNRDGLEIVRVAVNVSLVQFMVKDLTEAVRQALAEYDVAPGGLTLEITESVFERESDTLLRQLRTLHEMGVRLSLDDFGTGYSSLLYLQKYPFDEIKIDRGFVQRMLADDYSHRIVNTVIGIAGGLGAEVVAEGVETAAVRDALIEHGCHVGQGFYYSMPLDTEDFRWLLQKRRPLPLTDSS